MSSSDSDSELSPVTLTSEASSSRQSKRVKSERVAEAAQKKAADASTAAQQQLVNEALLTTREEIKAMDNGTSAAALLEAKKREKSFTKEKEMEQAKYLAEYMNRGGTKGQIAEFDAELKSSSAGVPNLEDVDPEHRKLIADGQRNSNEIPHYAPGVNVFKYAGHLHLLKPDADHLSTAATGPFTEILDIIRDKCSDPDSECVREILCGGVLKTLCAAPGSLACPASLCKWLFRLMTWSKNECVSLSCFNVLFAVIKKGKSGWMVSITDMFEVFVAHGADPEKLGLPDEIMKSKLDGTCRSGDELRRGNEEGVLANHNVALVIRLVGESVRHGRGLSEQKWSLEHIRFAICALCCMSLDPKTLAMQLDIMRCLTLLIDAGAAEAEWTATEYDIAEHITKVVPNHHNSVTIVQRLPLSPKGE